MSRNCLAVHWNTFWRRARNHKRSYHRPHCLVAGYASKVANKWIMSPTQCNLIQSICQPFVLPTTFSLGSVDLSSVLAEIEPCLSVQNLKTSKFKTYSLIWIKLPVPRLLELSSTSSSKSLRNNRALQLVVFLLMLSSLHRLSH